MFYKKHLNVEEILNSYLNRTIMKDIQSRDFKTRKCNYNKQYRICNGGTTYVYSGDYR